MVGASSRRRRCSATCSAGWFVPWLGPVDGDGRHRQQFLRRRQPPANYFEDAGVGLIFRPRAFRASARDVCATKREFAAQAPRYGELSHPPSSSPPRRIAWSSPQRHARALAADLPDRGTGDRARHRPYAAPAEDRSGHRGDSACQRHGGDAGARASLQRNDSILERGEMAHAGFWWDRKQRSPCADR